MVASAGIDGKSDGGIRKLPASTGGISLLQFGPVPKFIEKLTESGGKRVVEIWRFQVRRNGTIKADYSVVKKWKRIHPGK